MKPVEIILTAYGNEGKDRGIVFLSYDKDKKTLKKDRVLSLSGKCNLVTEAEDVLYTSIKYKEGNRVELYQKDSFELIQSIPSEYFYSYGQIVDHHFLLASYESGVDSVLDLKNQLFTAHCIHQKEGCTDHGKSHYIQCLKDGQIIGIENELQQLILYKNMNLEIDRMIEYPPINIRLLSVHPDGKTAYMNTEYSNELIVLDTSDWSVINRFKLTENSKSYSGGNAISDDGRYVCVSVRGDDVIHVFENTENQLIHKGKFSCGRIPRDLMFVNHDLLVTCTEDHSVEVYDLDNDCMKVCEAEVFQPITFRMK